MARPTDGGIDRPTDGVRYPLFLDLTGRRVVVVGGGPVAARRTGGLLDAGADVTVVAPQLSEPLARLNDRLTWLAREYVAGDLDGARLVHTATGDRAVDERVAADAEARGIWCVRADDAAASAAWTPAVTRADDIAVAVSAGGDPRRAAAIKSEIAERLATGDLPVRRRRRGGPGKVTLIGGGPGDPGLITTRGRRALSDADVVVTDRLAPRALLDELHPDVEVVYAGKGPDAHHLTQVEINALLVERARSGAHVVRLKGGDPFVLGRGGEEVVACARAGVPCEVIPGVTSATAVPAAAGIPVTHRAVSGQFTVVSAHTAPETGRAGRDDGPDWRALAGLDGTLVVLMGVRPLAEICAALVEQGKPATTPAAIIERGTLPDQRTITGTIGTLAARAADAEVTSPAVIVIGDVVTQLGDSERAVER